MSELPVLHLVSKVALAKLTEVWQFSRPARGGGILDTRGQDNGGEQHKAQELSADYGTTLNLLIFLPTVQLLQDDRGCGSLIVLQLVVGVTQHSD
jgi:hypothetical protein